MRISVEEFFAILKNGMTLRSTNPLCGEVYVSESKGKRYLVMHWPEDNRIDIDKLGDFKPVVRKPVRIPLERFETFAKRLFNDAEFFMEISDPDREEVT